VVEPLLDPLRGSGWIGNSVLLVSSPPDRDTTVAWGVFFIGVVCRENKFEKVLRDPESFLPFPKSLLIILFKSSAYNGYAYFIRRRNGWLVTAHRMGTRSGTPLTCINLHLRVFPGARATPASWYVLRFPAFCFGQISQGGAGSPIRWIRSISHHRSCADAFEMTDRPPRQQSNGQWRAPSAAPQAAMLLTLSAHCLLPKRPRPEIDAIGHRSPFCEQFLTEWVLTTQAISRKDPVAHAAAYLPSCFCKDK
jgi:hypothetical protein